MDNRLTIRCHSGEVVFDMTASLDFIAASCCDFSFCRRPAAVMVSCLLDALKIQQGGNILALYQRNTHTARHYICKIFGIYTFHQRRTDPLVYGINIGCFDDLDLAAFQYMPMADSVSLSLIDR